MRHFLPWHRLTNFERWTFRPAFNSGRPIKIVATTTFIAGLLAIFQVITSRFPETFDAFLPFDYDYLSRTLSLLFGMSLVYVSFKLIGRRRIAWWIAVAGSVIVIVAHAVYVETFLGTAASLILPSLNLILLLTYRREFTIPSEPRSIVRGLGFSAVVIGVALLYGTIGFMLLDKRDFGHEFSLLGAVYRTLRELLFVGNNDLQPTSQHATYFQGSLHFLSAAAAALVLYSLFRPLTYRLNTLPYERAQVGIILRKYSQSAQDFFKLHPPDKSYFFSRSGEAVIAYKVARGIALSMGDPAGPPQELRSTVHEFTEYCHAHGWEPAFAHSEPEALAAYGADGFRRLKIGEDASVNLTHFAMSTVRLKDFRKVRNRFEREGFRFEKKLPPHDPKLLKELQRVSDAWLSLPGRQERGFALGYFSKPYVSQATLFLARDGDGVLAAFANEVPSYKPNDASIDLMRHRLEVPNGLMDWLLMQTLLTYYQGGCKTFDLGFSPLSGLGTHPASTVEEEVLAYLAERTNRWFAFKGLRNYKDKFEPTWENRWLIYRGGRTNLVRTAVASVMAMKV